MQWRLCLAFVRSSKGEVKSQSEQPDVRQAMVRKSSAQVRSWSITIGQVQSSQGLLCQIGKVPLFKTGLPRWEIYSNKNVNVNTI